jgi:hypothetical protein
MTDHDNFIFNLERKQARIKAAIKAYKMQYLSTADTQSKHKKPTQKDNLKAKLLGNK